MSVPRMQAQLFAALLALFASRCYGHGAMTIPLPRNSIDSDLPPWSQGVPIPVPFQPWCPYPSAAAVGHNLHNLSATNGQACFWFSNGCAPGCEACDGSTRGPIPHFDSQGKLQLDYNDPALCKKLGKPDDCVPGARQPVCAKPMAATNCAARSINTDVECGSREDIFYYSPWRAPGFAPVIDPCGAAGGRLAGQGLGNFGAAYVNTTNAQVGDVGSKLPVHSSSVVWEAGSSVEVAWTLQANHAGGYSYRLCPSNEALTEACFQNHPLDFVGQQSLRWGGVGGEQIYFDGTYTRNGTSPAGSMWARNPIPRRMIGNGNMTAFPPYCGDQPGCTKAPVFNQAFDDGNDAAVGPECRCSEGGETGLGNLEIVDLVKIPEAHIAPGKWVLGWRWDCEESNQIWASCAEIEIIAK